MTIRRSLLLSVGVLIVGLAFALVAIIAYTGDQLVGLASRRVTDRALDRAESELLRFFEPVGRNLAMARGWFEAGTLDPLDDEALNRFFLPLLAAYPQISSINLGDAEGRGWMLLRRDDGWLNRRVDPPAQGDAIVFHEWAAGKARRERRVDPSDPSEAYDPRTRDWWVAAVEGARKVEPDVARPNEIYWTDPYPFFTTREPGITGVVHVDTPRGRWLLAFDLLLRDVTAFTQAIEVTSNGFVGVLSQDRRLVGVPRLPGLTGADARPALLARPADLGIEVFDDAIARGGDVPDPRTLDPGESLFAFESGGERWWADVRVLPVVPDRYLLLVVQVPERDLLGPIQQLRGGVLALVGLALLVAIGSAWQLARSFSRPLADLASNSTRMRHLDLRPGLPVQSRIAEIGQLAGAQESMRTALDAFSRYVPTDVVRELVELGAAARIGGERKSITVMFSDIEGFTRIAETKSPEALTQHLAGYFDELLPRLEDVGTVDKLVGDGIMAFWGAPLPDAHHARNAVEAICECRHRLEALNEGWRTAGEPPLPTRFGLASGPALVGNVGSARRLSYTAVGDVVNLASRLEGLNRIYGTQVLVADPVPQLAGEGFVWREVDRVRVVGRVQAVDVHELLGERDEVDPPRVQFARNYERALAHHRARSFPEAIAVLDGLDARWQQDRSVVRLRAATARWLETPPPEDWEPITPLDQK